MNLINSTQRILQYKSFTTVAKNSHVLRHLFWTFWNIGLNSNLHIVRTDRNLLFLHFDTLTEKAEISPEHDLQLFSHHFYKDFAIQFHPNIEIYKWQECSLFLWPCEAEENSWSCEKQYNALKCHGIKLQLQQKQQWWHFLEKDNIIVPAAGWETGTVKCPYTSLRVIKRSSEFKCSHNRQNIP